MALLSSLTVIIVADYPVAYGKTVLQLPIKSHSFQVQWMRAVGN